MEDTMKYELAIFDMDGTILNTLEDLTDSLNASLTHFGYPTRTLEEVRCFVGNGLMKLMERAVPANTSTSDIQKVFAYFFQYYQEHCAIKTRPYDTITKTIETIREKGIKTAVVSNKADVAVQELCLQYFPGLFDFAIGEKEGNKRKPAPDAVNETLEVLGFQKEQAVYIGDSDVDLATAKNANLDCIAVAWGFRDEAFLKEHGATCIIKKPEDLLTLL